MPLDLIYGPPNSGRRGLIRRGFAAALDRDPVLVVPTIDDVFSFERELCQGKAMLGGAVMTFRGLFGAVARVSEAPPAPELTLAQRLRAISVAIASRRERLGPLRHSASRPGFALALERLLDELQGAGLRPADLGGGAGTLEGSAYVGDLAELFAAYAELRDRLGRADAHTIARQAIASLQDGEERWRRPVFLYGFDDLTRNQLDLVAALAAQAGVTVALTFEPNSASLAARATLLEQLREIGVDRETATEPDPGNTDNRLLFDLERGFGSPEWQRRPPGEGLTLLRSAGARSEAEAIGAETARLVAGGANPGEIAIALRDPSRRGPQLAATLESYGLATALEAELPVTVTSVGGTLVALLSAELGGGRIGDLLRFLRGPSGISAGQIDWFERAARRRRLQSAAAGLEHWQERHDERLPGDVERIRAAAAAGPADLPRATARLALTMASRPLRTEEDGPPPGHGDGLELRAAATIANALEELAELPELAPRPEDLAATIGGLRLRAWSGPIEGRVRIASPYRLRAGRFDHVFVGSLQDGEFPRRERGGDPFLSEGQRASLGLEPRRDIDAEERYLFHACLALPRERLYLSYRDSDENGVAEARSPFVDDVRDLLDPPSGGEEPDPVEAAISRERDLTRVVHRIADSPSEDELARAVAAHGSAADAGALLAAAGAPEQVAERVGARIEAARAAEEASRAPGPLREPAAIEALQAVPAYGGTTLEGFDLCSYRWFVSHELDPQQLDPAPDPLVQGGLMHAVLDRLYREHQGDRPLPRPDSLPAWRERGHELLAEVIADRGLGRHPAERAMTRRVEVLLDRFLAEEAARDPGGFEPWLFEARFGEEEGSERRALELDGWYLHGAIDRVDGDAAGRALVIDYKLASSVTPRQKLEEQAKLQLQLYLIAVAEQWGAEPVGGLYHPLRGSSARRPRGVVLAEAAPELGSYGLARTDLVDEEEFEQMLAEARARAGEIVARMRRGDIRRDPGPRRGLRGHGVCPPFCDFAPICRRDRAPVMPEDEEGEER